MYTRKVILERFETTSKLYFYVHLMFYQLGITCASFWDPMWTQSHSSTDANGIWKSFWKEIPLWTYLYYFVGTFAVSKPSGPSSAKTNVTRFSIRFPFQGVRKLSKETPSGIPTGLAASRHPPAPGGNLALRISDQLTVCNIPISWVAILHLMHEKCHTTNYL